MKTYLKLFLLILICTGAAHTQSLRLIHEDNLSVSEGKLLEVEASSGDVNIVTWNKNQVDVKIFGNKKAKDKFNFEIKETSNGVKVKIEREGRSFFNWFSNIELKVEIKVPAKFDAEIQTSGGDIEIFDLEGFVDISTSGGDILTDNCTGQVKTSTSGGDINIKKHLGSGYFTTSGGDIRLFDFLGDVKASTSGGDIELWVENGEVDAETTGGDVSLEYRGENKGIFLETTGGNIKIKVPAQIEADVYLSTTGGDAELDHSNSRISKMKSSEIRASLNGGGKQIKCKTFGGDVILLEK